MLTGLSFARAQLSLTTGTRARVAVYGATGDAGVVTLAPTAVTWSSSNPTAVQVSSDGWISAVAAGSYSVTATVGTASASLSLNVQATTAELAAALVTMHRSVPETNQPAAAPLVSAYRSVPEGPQVAVGQTDIQLSR